MDKMRLREVANSLSFIKVALCITCLCITCQFARADLSEDYKREELIPDVFDTAPNDLLSVSYNGKNFQVGNELTPTEIKDAPTIEWNADDSSFYTLIMNDPDAPTRQNAFMGEFLHWMIVNIPGKDLNKGEELAQYLGGSPPLGTGYHRYTFSVYRQPGRINFDEKILGSTSIDGRPNFNIRKFAAKYNLGEPIAGNMFQAMYDDYVPEALKRLGLQDAKFI